MTEKVIFLEKKNQEFFEKNCAFINEIDFLTNENKNLKLNNDIFFKENENLRQNNAE